MVPTTLPLAHQTTLVDKYFGGRRVGCRQELSSESDYTGMGLLSLPGLLALVDYIPLPQGEGEQLALPLSLFGGIVDCGKGLWESLLLATFEPIGE